MRTSNRLPAAAVAADVLALALFATGSFVVNTGGLTSRVAGVRLSVHSAWRAYLWAAIVLIVRNAAVRHPPSFAWALGPFRRSARARLARSARDPLPLEEHALFHVPASRGEWWRQLACLVLGFSVLVIALTWPQARHLNSVADLGDPLFSVWRIAWVSHQLPRHPLALFDANQFYPERLTLTYSDSLLVPSLIAAPFFWMGGNAVVIYNALLLSGFVLSGVTMFFLVRALTGRGGAALVAGAVFALYPYRYEHYSHLELEMTMFMPLALLGLHRTLARGRLRDGLWTGAAFALQSLSSLYYGCFLAVYMTVLGLALWIGRGRPLRPLAPLAAGALLAAVLIAPVAAEYIASRPMMGNRDEGTIQFYSAEGPDYLKSTSRSLWYDWSSHDAHPERQLFPRIAPVVLAAIGIWPPLSIARIGYAIALVVAIDGSFGFNGPTFTALHAVLTPFKGLRVPARFSVLAGMTLAILAGYGVARLLGRWPARRRVLIAAMLVVVAVEAIPRLQLESVWRTPPDIYASIAGNDPPVVLAEFPMPKDIYSSDFDARYLYFSTFHWQTLVNGNSGFFPPSYVELLAREREFPSAAALDYLRSRGVQYLTMHGRFTNPGRYQNTIAVLDARPDLELVARAPWEGSESRLYRFR
jgi:hypothetical protein